MELKYRHLTKDKFDAIVTGELTHHAIWLEGIIVDTILDFFSMADQKREDFKRLVFMRDGLTFQDKIDIARGIIPLLNNPGKAIQLEKLLQQVEDLKRYRNAFAHGVDVGEKENDQLHLKISIVSRSGKEKTIGVTPETHEKHMKDLDVLFENMEQFRATLNN